MRGTTGTFKCLCCGDPFVARTADRKRGWARYCSKACKAKRQEQHTGQHAAYREREDRSRDDWNWPDGVEGEFSNAHLFSNEE
jgi:hypothetical protein